MGFLFIVVFVFQETQVASFIFCGKVLYSCVNIYGQHLHDVSLLSGQNLFYGGNVQVYYTKNMCQMHIYSLQFSLSKCIVSFDRRKLYPATNTVDFTP